VSKVYVELNFGTVRWVSWVCGE